MLSNYAKMRLLVDAPDLSLELPPAAPLECYETTEDEIAALLPLAEAMVKRFDECYAETRKNATDYHVKISDEQMNREQFDVTFMAFYERELSYDKVSQEWREYRDDLSRLLQEFQTP